MRRLALISPKFEEELLVRQAFATIALAAFIVTLGSAAVAVAQQQRTLKGEVVDVACYQEKSPEGGGYGDEHAACALTCAKKGQDLAVVTNDGLYIITGDVTKNNNAKLIEFVAKEVEARSEERRVGKECRL